MRNTPTERCPRTCASARRRATGSSSQGPLGSFYLRPLQRPPSCWPAAPAWRRSCRCWTSSARTAADHPIHLIFGVTNDADLVKLES